MVHMTRTNRTNPDMSRTGPGDIQPGRTRTHPYKGVRCPGVLSCHRVNLLPHRHMRRPPPKPSRRAPQHYRKPPRRESRPIPGRSAGAPATKGPHHDTAHHFALTPTRPRTVAIAGCPRPRPCRAIPSLRAAGADRAIRRLDLAPRRRKGSADPRRSPPAPGGASAVIAGVPSLDAAEAGRENAGRDLGLTL